jgi:hypothetical protein
MDPHLAANLASLSTQTTINTIISGLIMCLSVIKPILMEYIRRRWWQRDEEPRIRRLTEQMSEPASQ